MPGMKRDMGGAAAVLAGFSAAVTSGGTTRPLHAILCLAENTISATATRPDDVHTLYSGKTVEVGGISVSTPFVPSCRSDWVVGNTLPARRLITQMRKAD